MGASSDPHEDADREFDPTRPEHRDIGTRMVGEEGQQGSAFAHLYRGEVTRMENWRARLDRTTHWSVLVIAAILTWGFSQRSNPHYVFLLGMLILSAMVVIEARRFQGYDIWRNRVRTIQRNVYAYALDPSQGLTDRAWREKLSRDYRASDPRIGIREAIAHRLRRVYVSLYLFVLVAWTLRVTGFASRPWPRSATVAGVSGTVVTGLVVAFVLAVLAVAYRPRQWNVERELH